MNRLALSLFFAGALLLQSFSIGGMAAETKPAAESKPAADAGKPLFDGKTLAGWKPTGFAGGGEAKVEKGELLIDQGETLSGVTFTNEVLRMNYEISLEAKRVSGSDFFCGLTFPVGTNCVTLVVGGWGGAVTGISSIDHQDASDNETTKYIKYDTGKWYPIKVRVTPDKIQVWIEGDKLVDFETTKRRLSMRPGEIEDSQPLGLATYQTSGAYRNIRVTNLAPAAAKQAGR